MAKPEPINMKIFVNRVISPICSSETRQRDKRMNPGEQEAQTRPAF